MSTARNHDGWTVLVPVKSSRRGKSRIAVPARRRQQIARAMAADTVAAAASAFSVARVLVVADDSDDAELLAGIAGVRVLLTDASTLNAAIEDGLARVSGPVAVLPGDLPGVTGQELDAVLAAAQEPAAQHPMVVVPDRQGRGTTLLAAIDPNRLLPRYGADSFRRHQQAGAVPMTLPVDSWIRRDVDTLEDLAEISTGRTGELTAESNDGAARDLGRVC